MKEFCEFRVDEKYVHLLFAPKEGQRLGDSVRKVMLSTSDHRFAEVGRLQGKLRKEKHEPFFYGWSYHRTYTRKEIQEASFYHLLITSFFEPAGEECGTTYDYTKECKACGVGRIQTSPLHLTQKRIPKSKDIAETIGREIVISKRLAGLFTESGLKGFELRPVLNKAGRTLDWYQLWVTSRPIGVAAPTRFGIGPFDDDKVGEYRCPFGHVAGLNILSELYLRRSDWDGSDINVTKEYTGSRGGLIVPEPILVISKGALAVLEKNKAKGFKIEVAYAS